ncbi:carboxypeptidase-like regulatory domain-containing protein [Winogradskyella sp.]|uniref:carboxypeptidase-like regulatory domain-containing protein n=1 Tax=Winogradskyella sp. TaxID=1883156 RepID=UPI003BAD1498
MRIFIVCIVFNFFSFQLIFSQNSGQILAKVIDIETSEPVSYATIRIKDSNQGIIADYNGEFRIPLAYRDAIILITSIGYEAKEILLNELNIKGINIIKIKTQIEALDPVFISSRTKVKGVNFIPKNLIKNSRKLSAKDIVLRAISRIPKNLSHQPHSYIGYYRDYQLLDNKFHNLNEAILETFDQGIYTNSLAENTVSTAIYSFNQNEDFTIDPSLTKAYDGITKYIKHSQILPRGGNEHTILNIHNPIRNYNFSTFSYVYNLKIDFPELHQFRKGKIVFLNNEPLIVIKFKNAKPHDKSLYGLKTARSFNNEYVQGSIYISLVDYSIHRFNYKVHPPDSKKALYNVSLEYARQNDKMYLNYITFNNSFVIGEAFELREEKVQFDKAEQAFYITFNNTVDYLDYRTLKAKNFKFKLGDKNLRTISAERETPRVVKVTVKNFDGSPIDINSENIDELSYKLKNIRDTSRREIYRAKTLKGDQFREFFVQKVNENKPLSDSLSIMDKNSPIKESILNDFPEKNQYWINSPLMDKKYRD